MASEFEELRLTVTLADSASAGLQKIRGEIGQLTESAKTMTTGMVQASAGLSSLASTAQVIQPKLRSLNTELKELQKHAAEVGKSLGEMGSAAKEGFEGLPQIAIALYDAVGGVKGLGEAMKSASPAAKISTQALIGVGLGVAAVGAAVVAYGVSVFRLAKDMNHLNDTARAIGISFGELKNAQDQAKSFGIATEVITRSFQGVQAAQLDLYKSNSTLRQKLASKDVDANWIDSLLGMNPREYTNAAVVYAKSLEAQALSKNSIPTVARGLANKFLTDLGVAIEMMDMPPLKPLTKKQEDEMAHVAKLSKEVMDIWNPLTVKMERIKLEVLKHGLPKMAELLGDTDKLVDNIKKNLDELGDLFAEIGKAYQAIRHPTEHSDWWADTIFGKKGTGPRDNLEWLGKTIGARAMTGQPEEPGSTTQDNKPSAPISRFMSDELSDETKINTSQMEKLTEQIERLNNFYDRSEAGSGKFGIASASGGGGATGGWSGGGATGSWRGGGGGGAFGGAGASSGGEVAAASGGLSKKDAQQILSGGNIDPTVSGGGTGGAGQELNGPQALAIARQHLGEDEIRDQGKLSAFFRNNNISVNPAATPWCAAFVNSTLKAAGVKGTGSLAAGSFTRYGSAVPENDVQAGDIGVVRGGSPRTGIEGQHVGFLTGETRMGPSGLEAKMLGGNQGGTVSGQGGVTEQWRPVSSLHLRRPHYGSGMGSGSYPSSLLSANSGARSLGLDASIGSRSDLDRNSLNDNTTIDATGKVKVQVGGATASEKTSGGDLFKTGHMQTVDQMPTTSTGGANVDEVAKQYMTTR